MTNNKVQFVGSPCGHHGSYSFYKGLRYTSSPSSSSGAGRQRILALGEFVFLKIWDDEDIISIGEPQLIWEDRASNNMLVSLRLYFMPENTPDGRTEEHGEHEVICLSEKVVIRAEDLVTLIRTAAEVKWQTGLRGVYGSQPNLVSSLPPQFSTAASYTITSEDTTTAGSGGAASDASSTTHNNNKASVPGDVKVSSSPPPQSPSVLNNNSSTNNNSTGGLSQPNNNNSSGTTAAGDTNTIKTEPVASFDGNSNVDTKAGIVTADDNGGSNNTYLNNVKNNNTSSSSSSSGGEGDTKLSTAITTAIENCKISGRGGGCLGTGINSGVPETMYYPPPAAGALDIREIKREKKLINDVITPSTTHPLILSYDRYCRMRALMVRVGHLEESMRSNVVQALGGFLVPSRNTLLLFCRDVFEYQELEAHELLCTDLAPKLQGRPRKKHKKRPSSGALNSSLHSTGNNSDSDSSEEAEEMAKPKLKGKPGLSVPPKPGLAGNKPNSLRALDRKAKPTLESLQGGGYSRSGSGSSSIQGGGGGAGLSLSNSKAGSGSLRGHHSGNSKQGYLHHPSHHHLQQQQQQHQQQQQQQQHHLATSNALASLGITSTGGMVMSGVSSPTITSTSGKHHHHNNSNSNNITMQGGGSGNSGGGGGGSSSNNNKNSSSQSSQQAAYLSSMQAHLKLGHQQQPQHTDFPALNRLIEVDFMSKLHKFMRDRKTPITRLPHIGYTQLNLFELFSKVQQLGGYEAVCDKKQWKMLFDQMHGGVQHQQQQPGAATPTASPNNIRRHYERLLYPYESFLLNEQKRIYGADASAQMQQQHQQLLQQSRSNNNKKQHSSENEPSVSILQVPNITSMKKEPPIPADLAKRPEITITPIPRSINETLAGVAAAANAVNNPLGMLGPGFPPSLNLKALGLDFPGLDLNMVDFNALNNLTDIAKKYDKNNQLNALAAVAAAAAASSSLTCEPATKRFKPDDGRMNGARDGGGGVSSRYHPQQQESSGRGRRPSALELQAAASELSKMRTVPDLVSADFLRSMNMLDANSKLLLPAHQSTKTINALAALLPQTSIFPAPAPAAHQQNSTRSPMKSSQTDSPRQEPPRVFQSQSLYATGNRIYDKPTADRMMTSSPKDSHHRELSKSSSPEIQILDLSRPPSSGLGSGTSSSGGKNGKSCKSDRLDVELLDLSTRRDITVSAVPKPSPGNKHSSRLSSVPQVSIKSSEGITITPNHSNNSSRSGNYRGSGGSSSSSNNNALGNMGGLAGLSNAELNNLLSGMPGAALMAAAAAAAQGLPQGLQGLPPGLASLGLGGPGSMGSLPPGNLPASLLPFLMGAGAGGSPITSKNSNSSSSYHNSPSSSSGNSNNNSNNAAAAAAAAVAAAGMPPMFPYLDPNSLAAYYSSMMPPSLLQASTSSASSSPVTSLSQASLSSASLAAAHQAAAVQMAQLSSLGLGNSLSGLAGLPHNLGGAGLSGLGGGGPSGGGGVNQEALANLGMYKNFLGGAAAASANNSGGGNSSSSNASMMPPPHFLAALMSPGSKQPKK